MADQNTDDAQKSHSSDGSKTHSGDGKKPDTESLTAPPQLDMADFNPEQQNRNILTSAFTYAILFVAILAILAILYAWRLPPFETSVQSTDDAYLQGYVAGISPQVSGEIVSVPFRDFMHVKAGELLVKVDDRTYVQKVAQAKAALETAQVNLREWDNNVKREQAAVELARAQLKSAEASLSKSELDGARTGVLELKGYTSHANGDSARAGLLQSQANVEQARAQISSAEQTLELTILNRPALEAAVQDAQANLHIAELNLMYTSVRAPADGQLGIMSARVGQIVSSGTQVTTLTTRDVWLTANYKETQIAKFKQMMPATFTVDALDHEKFTGFISRMSPASGSQYSVIKPDNATGNFTKIVQRFPIRIDIDANQQNVDRLRPGMSVVISVDTSASPLEQWPPTAAGVDPDARDYTNSPQN